MLVIFFFFIFLENSKGQFEGLVLKSLIHTGDHIKSIINGHINLFYGITIAVIVTVLLIITFGMH